MLKVKSKIAEKLNIPADISYGVPIVTITGNNEIYVENYKGIIEYGKKCIRIHAKDCTICFQGNNMEIIYYTNVDMKITGDLESVCYC